MRTKTLSKFDPDLIQGKILQVRGMKVILDSDLALIYGVEIRVINQQVKRNGPRFPADFSFVLAPAEWDGIQSLRSQNVILKQGRHRKYPPRVFTEHGAIMAATVLNSARAIEMSVFVVRAFVRMRAAFSDTAALEREVKARLDGHDAAIVDVLRRFMEILDPPPLPEPPPKSPIGFGVKEKAARYGARRKRAQPLNR